MLVLRQTQRLEDVMQFDLTWQGYIVVGAMSPIVAIWLAWEVYRWCNRYVGFGWILRWRHDGTVFVSSRLLKSPAHKAGIHGNGAETLLTYNGRPMWFATKVQFKQYFAAHKPTVGERIRCTYKRGGKEFEAVLEAAVIQGPVPEHPPTARPSPYDADYQDHHYGMVVCLRTGYWVPTMRLSDEALNRFLGA